MAKRITVDCDRCEKKNLTDPASLTYKTGGMCASTGEYDTRTVDLCGRCASQVISTLIDNMRPDYAHDVLNTRVRAKKEVRKQQGSAHGCCERFADNMACDCLAKAV